jgi:hypothetical protein
MRGLDPPARLPLTIRGNQSTMITKRERLEKAYKHLRNLASGRRGNAVPVFIFGEQRSGTNMLLDCFRRSPRTAIYNETDDDAFVDYELRDLAIIADLVHRSPASHVVLKPTADGNRASEILDALPGSRAVWIYRRYQDAVTSALALFRETSLQYLQKVATRAPTARWRSINLSSDDVAMVDTYLRRGISEASARALIWYIRNGFYFRLGLDRRKDVMLINYEELVGSPKAVVAQAFGFVGLDFQDRYVARVFGSSVGRRPTPELDPDIVALCDRMMVRLSRRSETAATSAAAITEGLGA